MTVPTVQDTVRELIDRLSSHPFDGVDWTSTDPDPTVTTPRVHVRSVGGSEGVRIVRQDWTGEEPGWITVRVYRGD